jgi:hypothetical protein
MISNLPYPEFEQRLMRLTYDGDPFMMGSPLKILGINDEEEPFYGWAGKGKFTITNNSFRYPSRSVIEGSQFNICFTLKLIVNEKHSSRRCHCFDVVQLQSHATASTIHQRRQASTYTGVDIEHTLGTYHCRQQTGGLQTCFRFSSERSAYNRIQQHG